MRSVWNPAPRCLCIVSGCFGAITAELSSCHRACKAQNIYWLVLRQKCLSVPYTWLLLAVSLKSPQTAVEALSNRISSSPIPAALKRLLNFLWDLDVQKPCLAMSWEARVKQSIHSWGVEGVPGCFSTLLRGVSGARAFCSSASAASPGPAWQGHACQCFLRDCVMKGVTRLSQCCSCF